MPRDEVAGLSLVNNAFLLPKSFVPRLREPSDSVAGWDAVSSETRRPICRIDVPLSDHAIREWKCPATKSLGSRW